MTELHKTVNKTQNKGGIIEEKKLEAGIDKICQYVIDYVSLEIYYFI